MMISDCLNTGSYSREWTRRAAGACLLAFLFLFSFTPNALAQTGRVGDFCVGSVANVGNCTAGDVAIEQFFVSEVMESCIQGTPFEAEVRFEALILGAQPARYGVGIFVNLDGESALTGDRCLHDYLAPFTSDDALWQQDGDGNYIEPFPEKNEDMCGDIPSGRNSVLKTLQTVRIACNDTTGDGFVNINACASWLQNQNEFCSGVADAIPGASSKCGCSEVDTGLQLPASVTIIKQSNNGDETFDFTSDLPPGGDIDQDGNFSITTSGGTGQLGPVAVDPGSYTIEEVPDQDWAVQASCDNGDSPDDLTVGPGDEVTCTFINTSTDGDAEVTVRKETNDGDGTFQFQSDLPLGTFSLTTSGGSAETIAIPVTAPATYTITEIVPAGWEFDSVVGCAGATPQINGNEVTVQFNVEDQDDITCTFINNKLLGSITVAKETDPSGSDQSFSISVSGPDFNGSFPLQDSQSDTTGDIGIGEYTVSESALPGWVLEEIDCGAKGSTTTENSLTFTLDEDDDVTCTFTNRQQLGEIVVVKDTDPPGSDQDFDVRVSGVGFDDDLNVTDAQSASTGPIAVGGYQVEETPPPGWTLQDIDCRDQQDNPAPGFTFDGSIANFDLEDGDVITCTVTNAIERGTITVEKVADPSDTEQLFSFSSNFAGDFTLGAGEEEVTSDLLPSSKAGTYSVSEMGLAGWTLDSATCDGGNAPDNIDLQPGETVTCTFTNSINRGTIIVEKVADPDDTGAEFSFASNFAGDFTLSAGDQEVTDDLLPSSEAGSYSVSETLPDGWVLESATCDNGDDPSDIDLGPGDEVTCTFSNSQLPAGITVTKETIPAGATEAFAIRIVGPDFDNTDNEELLAGGESFSTGEIDPGSYTITEIDIPDDWVLESITCGSASASVSGSSVTVDLEAGQSANCTFTNREQSVLPPALPVPATGVFGLAMLLLLMFGIGGWVLMHQQRRRQRF